MTLDDTDFDAAVAFRHRLHEQPELSGEEAETAQAVETFLRATRPDQVLTGLGGYGVAAVYGTATRPTVLVRCELDGLPIAETGDVVHRSRVPGKGHLCGHDGHMATLAAMARALGRERPPTGRVVLLFQPAEEIGAGARAVIADPRFATIRPDMALSYHNMPGVPLGSAWLDAGPVNCASRGLRIIFTGRTSHASQPENGISPMPALARLMPALAGFSGGEGRDFAMVTVTHARLGEPAFGIAPGAAELWVTLRTLVDDRMADLASRAQALVRQVAGEHGLSVAFSEHDVFAHVENAPAAVAVLARALDDEGVPHERGGLPFRASEDFGLFGRVAPAAMVFMGAGEHHASLHNPDYDFPDALLPIAARVLIRACRSVLSA